MDGLRDQFLASPALAGDQDGGIGRGDPREHLQNPSDLRARCDDLRKLLVLSQAGLEIEILSDNLPFFVRLLDEEIEVCSLAWLRNIGVRAELHSLHCSGDGSVSGENDHLRDEGPLLHLLEHLHAAQLRHLEIQNNDIEFVHLEFLEGLPTVRGDFSVVPLPSELCFQHSRKVFLVVGDQDPDLALCGSHHLPWLV